MILIWKDYQNCKIAEPPGLKRQNLTTHKHG
jgi:hypothetical protein